MHPILFHIPLPKFSLPYAWLFYAAAVIAAIFGVYALVRKQKTEGLIAAGVALAIVAARFVLATSPLASFVNGKLEVATIPIYSYGVMLGLSLVVGWYLTLGLADRDGLPKEEMANNYVVTALTAVVFSRVLYILTNFGEFESFVAGTQPQQIDIGGTLASMFDIRRGGLVAYGGFLGGLLGSFLYLRRHKLPLLPWADVAVPSLASGLMLTRIGCYLFGCDFGQPLKESAPAWLKRLGTFPHWAANTLDRGDGSPAWMQHLKDHKITAGAWASLPVHPTQLYESLVGACLLVLLLASRKRQKFRGQIFLLFGFGYGACRYLLEVLRDDAERGSIPPELPEHILIPAGAAILALGYVIGFSRLIKHPILQRVAQVLSFAPAVALYVWLKPEAFQNTTTMEFSTSQFIGITTGFASAAAFRVLYDAALAHPESAMALGLPVPAAAGDAPALVPTVDDDEDDDAPPPPKKKATKAKKTKAAAAEPPPAGED